MKQYMPLKPVKRGFKVWVRADAVSGYFCDIDVYVGKPSDGTSSETGLGERVILQLSECLRGGKYHLFCDNYFTTCHLLDTLLTHELYGCGTTRSNRRGFPETLKQVSLERGEHKFCQRSNLVASVWMDKKPDNLLSTLAQADVTHTAQRKQKDGTRLSVQCTDAVVLCNKYMAGVDKGDQLRQYYRVRSKCRKYYEYIFWFLFDVSITNAFILTQYSPTQIPNSQLCLKAFRLQLADQLIGSYCSRQRPGRPSTRTSTLPCHPPPPLPPPEQHGPLPAQTTRTALHLPSHQKKERCVYCLQYRNPAHRRDVVWYCKECPGQPALCMTGKEDGSDCFRLWHQALL